MITILVKAADGTMIASAQSAEDARLCIDRVYEDGDTVEILADEKHLCVQMDVTLLPGEVYLPNGRMTWRVPAGEHRLAYAPGAFEAKRHVITARLMTAEEINGRRDIACNPADLRGETDFFPHITANVETRNEACFCARNAINGLHCNNYHGEWPFGSWGIGAREDAWSALTSGARWWWMQWHSSSVRISRMMPTGSADTLCCPTARKSRSTCKRRASGKSSRWGNTRCAGCGWSGCRKATTRRHSPR